MIVYPPIVIVNIDSYYAMDMIHATNIWVFMVLILGVFINCGNVSDIRVGASSLAVTHSHVLFALNTIVYPRIGKNKLFYPGFYEN
jgi:hypothetical protein